MRKQKEINKAYSEFWDRVWYVRHKVMLEHIADGTETCDPKVLKMAKKAAKKKEKIYGKKSLRLTDFEYGLVSGRMSALAWLDGVDWEEGSLDT